MAKLEFDYSVGPVVIVVDCRLDKGTNTQYEAIRAAVSDYPDVASAEWAEWMSTDRHKLIVTFSDDAVKRGDVRERLRYFLRQLGVTAPNTASLNPVP